jgi:hypothetical protein
MVIFDEDGRIVSVAVLCGLTGPRTITNVALVDEDGTLLAKPGR